MLAIHRGGEEAALAPRDVRADERPAGANGGDLVQEVQWEASGAGRCAEDFDLVEGVGPEHARGLGSAGKAWERPSGACPSMDPVLSAAPLLWCCVALFEGQGTGHFDVYGCVGEIRTKWSVMWCGEGRAGRAAG